VALRPYQRQSLAFMLDVEHRIASGDASAGRGGWLCDEMVSLYAKKCRIHAIIFVEGDG